jgi:cell division septation protein DedD
MRTPFALALVLVVSACADRPERAEGSGALAAIPAGQDPIVLRVPEGGGLVTSLRYPGLDSTVWRSSYRVPPLTRVLAFDPEDGYLSAVDTSGRVVRLDLRLGAVSVPGTAGSARHASADGGTVFVLTPEGQVARLTPVGDRWSWTPANAAASLIPLRDASLIVAEPAGDHVQLRRVRPPDSAVVDSLRIDEAPGARGVFGVAVGDRVFVAVGERIVSVRTRGFESDLNVSLDGPVHDFVPSPSGDRVFVLAGDRAEVRVIDRFGGKVVERVKLPAAPRALRIDPLGRVLLVQGDGDAVWVIDVGTTELVGALRSTWRGDLPLVLPDGAVALVHGDTVTLASTLDLGVVRELADGARDTWHAMRWNGFRPRASGLDEPVSFRASGESARSDGAPDVGQRADAGAGTTGTTGVAETPSPAPVRDSATGTVQRDSGADERAEPARPRSVGFSVQFAAVLSEALAREAAAGISIDGRTPRITTSVRDGRTLYRVALGPFATRDEAERAGRASGKPYWVFEGAP